MKATVIVNDKIDHTVNTVWQILSKDLLICACGRKLSLFHVLANVPSRNLQCFWVILAFNKEAC